MEPSAPAASDDDNQIHIALLRQSHGFIQRQASGSAAPFNRVPAAGVFHQDLPHQVRRDPKEMRTVLPLRCALSGQSHVRFMHKGSALERMVAALLT